MNSLRMAGYPIAYVVCPTIRKKKAYVTMGEALATGGVAAKGTVVAHIEGGGIAPANQGFRKALESEAPYIAYINDDVSFPQQGWLKELIDVLETDPTIGVVGPSGRCRTLPQARGKLGMEWGVEEVRWLSFFCVVIKRKLLEQLKGFNPIYKHYGGDNEFCEETRHLGMKCFWAQHVYVEHELSDIIPAYKKVDEALFNQRWMPR